MTLRDFEDLIIEVLEKTAEDVGGRNVPPFLATVYEEGGCEKSLKFNLVFYDSEEFMKSIPKVKLDVMKGIRKLRVYNMDIPVKEQMKLVMFASGARSLINYSDKNDQSDSDLKEEISLDMFDDSIDGICFVVESELLSKLKILPVKDDQLMVNDIKEDILLNEFLVSGVLRPLIPVLN